MTNLKNTLLDSEQPGTSEQFWSDLRVRYQQVRLYQYFIVILQSFLIGYKLFMI